MIYRYIYKITCTAGRYKDKFYYGQHTTTNLNDGYKGSGRKIVDYYKKHPNDYIKEIIAFYNSEDELNQAEYDIILPFIDDPNCLNLQYGGYTGRLNKESIEKMSKSLKGRVSPMKGKKFSDEHKAKLSNAHKKLTHKLSEESKKKISESLKGHKISEETKRKISESLKHSEKYKLYMSVRYNKDTILL